MGISCNVFWHQTNKKGLKAILQSQRFIFSYSKEFYPIGSTSEIAFPMISFCHLPISEIGFYINQYGGYTIGMSLEWGHKNDISPVMYIGKDAVIAKLITNSENMLEKNILPYIKAYQGGLPKRGFKNYRFFDEREFRFVAPVEELKRLKHPFFLRQDATRWEYNVYKNEQGTSLIPNLSVSFDWSDIRYIILKNSTDMKDKFFLSIRKEHPDIKIFTIQEVMDDFIGAYHHKKMSQVEQSSYNRTHPQAGVEDIGNCMETPIFLPENREKKHAISDFLDDYSYAIAQGYEAAWNNELEEIYTSHQVDIQLLKQPVNKEYEFTYPQQLRDNTIFLYEKSMLPRKGNSIVYPNKASILIQSIEKAWSEGSIKIHDNVIYMKTAFLKKGKESVVVLAKIDYAILKELMDNIIAKLIPMNFYI